jgi:hypothetical protein
MEFVAKDWLADPKLSLCKEATRGIWIDALCCMHMQDRCDRLTGSITDLARLCRTTPNALRSAVDDLKLRGAATCTEENGLVTLICHRLSRLQEKRIKACKRQRKRRGVGECHADVTPSVTGDVTPPNTNPNPQPQKKEPPQPPAGGILLPEDLWTPEMGSTWARYCAHRKHKRATMTQDAADLIFPKFRKWGPRLSVLAMNNSVEQGWTGVFCPKGEKPAPAAVNGAGREYKPTVDVKGAASREQLAKDYLASLEPTPQDILIEDFKRAMPLYANKQVKLDSPAFLAWVFEQIKPSEAA